MSGGVGERLIVIGAGGHAKVVIEAVRAAALGEIVGLVDPNPAARTILGYPILGGDEIVPGLRAEGVASAVVALDDKVLRQRVWERLQALGFRLPAIVHPSARVSRSVGEGTAVITRAVVDAEAVVSEVAEGVIVGGAPAKSLGRKKRR